MVWIAWLDIALCNTIKQGEVFLSSQETYRENEAQQKSQVRYFKDIKQITKKREIIWGSSTVFMDRDKNADMGLQYTVAVSSC